MGGYKMETDAKKIIDEFDNKFQKCFKDVLDKYDGNGFFTGFQVWYYAITHFTNEQIIDFTPDFMLKVFYDPEDYIDTYYEVIVPTFEKSIAEQQTDVIHEIMITKGVSQGEAMIIADKAFDEQIGYFRVFFMALWSCFKGLREAVQKKEEAE
jgi:hypothetical protein